MCGVYEEYYWLGCDTTFLLHAASCVEFTRNIIGLGCDTSFLLHAASCVEFMRNVIGLGVILVSYYM